MLPNLVLTAAAILFASLTFTGAIWAVGNALLLRQQRFMFYAFALAGITAALSIEAWFAANMGPRIIFE